MKYRVVNDIYNFGLYKSFNGIWTSTNWSYYSKDDTLLIQHENESKGRLKLILSMLPALHLYNLIHFEHSDKTYYTDNLKIIVHE